MEKRALKVNPTDGRFYMTAARYLEMAHRYDEVLTLLQKALKKNPNVGLDDLIVSFESGTGTLEEYAKRRHRKADDYRKSYTPIFARANEMKGKYGTF